VNLSKRVALSILVPAASGLLILMAVGCSESSGFRKVVSSETNQLPRGEVLQLTCEICGECVPEFDPSSMLITNQFCPGQCCNGVRYTFRCRESGGEFQVTANECDQIEWITPDGIFPVFPVLEDGGS
jgi:hypothetical protein